MSTARCKNLRTLNRKRIEFGEQDESVTRGLAVLARFTCAYVDALAIMQFNFDGLITSVAAHIETHIVPAFP